MIKYTHIDLYIAYHEDSWDTRFNYGRYIRSMYLPYPIYTY